MIQDYFAELIKKFNEYHSNLLIDITKDDIHRIRTTLKRLKTFNILLDGLLFRKKDFPVELIKLFKLAGEIRDIQIQQNILEDYDDEYKDHLHKMYKNKMSEFKIKDSYSDELSYLISKLDKVNDYHIDEQIIANIQSRIEISYDDIRSMIKNASSENLHEIRIKVKRIYYTLLMLGIDDKVNELDNIQETIGLWHDYDVTIDCIKNFDKHENEKIIDSLKEKRDSLYSKSLELIKTL